MAEPKTKPWCPMTGNGDGIDYCVETKCAWWIDSTCCCAIVDEANSLREMGYWVEQLARRGE